MAITLLTDACKALDKLNDQKLEIKFTKEKEKVEDGGSDAKEITGWGGTPDHPFHYD